MAQRPLAYIHVIDGLAFGFHKLGEPYTLKHARAVAGSIPLIGNCGFLFLALAFVFLPDLDFLPFSDTLPRLLRLLLQRARLK